MTKCIFYSRQTLTKKEPVYQALWAQNTDYDEVLISPVMIQDHMPDRVLEALSKVQNHQGSIECLLSVVSDSVE